MQQQAASAPQHPPLVGSATPPTIYPPSVQSSNNGFSTAGIALGAIAFLFFPIVFGPVGIILAAVGKSKNEERATVALAVSISGTVVGIILGFAFAI